MWPRRTYLRVTLATCSTNAAWPWNGSGAQMSSSSVQPDSPSTFWTPLSTAGTGGANSTFASGDQPLGHASCASATAGAQRSPTVAAVSTRATRPNPAIKPSRSSTIPRRNVSIGRPD